MDDMHLHCDTIMKHPRITIMATIASLSLFATIIIYGSPLYVRHVGNTNIHNVHIVLYIDC
jgi:hypothetical protein